MNYIIEIKESIEERENKVEKLKDKLCTINIKADKDIMSVNAKYLDSVRSMSDGIPTTIYTFTDDVAEET